MIGNSVGAKGRNDFEDVKIVQWLLNKAALKYPYLGNLIIGEIKITGIMDVNTQYAIDDWAYYGDRLSHTLQTRYGNTLTPRGNVYEQLVFGVVYMTAPVALINNMETYLDPRILQALDGRINFEQFQFILKQAEKQALTLLGKEMQRHLDDPKVLAFLDLISDAEAWFDARFKQVLYNHKVGFIELPNLYNHPGKVAGRYQFTTDTWNRAKRELGLYDFTPESQDIAGVYLLSTLPAQTPSSPYPPNDRILTFVLKGDKESIEYAIELGSGTWASFPTKYEKKNEKWVLKENFDRNGRDESRYSPQHSAPLDGANGLLNLYEGYLKDRSQGK